MTLSYSLSAETHYTLTLSISHAGTPEERGLLKWKAQMEVSSSEALGGRAFTCYDLPFGMDAVRRYFKPLVIRTRGLIDVNTLRANAKPL